MTNKLMRCVLGAMVALSSLMVGAAAAHADAYPRTWVSVGAGGCLTAYYLESEWDPHYPYRVKQAPCDRSVSQQWVVEDHGDGYKRLVSLAFGRCIGVKGNSDVQFGQMTQLDCAAPATSQRWRIDTHRLPDGMIAYQLVAAHSGRCMAALTHSWDPRSWGQDLYQMNCDGVVGGYRVSTLWHE